MDDVKINFNPMRIRSSIGVAAPSSIRKWYILAAVGSVVLVGLAVGLAVGLGGEADEHDGDPSCCNFDQQYPELSLSLHCENNTYCNLSQEEPKLGWGCNSKGDYVEDPPACAANDPSCCNFDQHLYPSLPLSLNCKNNTYCNLTSYDQSYNWGCNSTGDYVEEPPACALVVVGDAVGHGGSGHVL